MKEHFNVMNPFEPLFKPIIGIANAFLKIGELIMLFVKLFIKVITTANVLFDPPRFINDIIIGSVIGISQFINSLLERFSLSNYFRSAVSNNENCNNNSNNNNSNNNNKVCYKPTFIYYLILLICPPLAVFTEVGIYGIVQVAICALLTIYAYYFPGLLYAILITSKRM
jgi:uncharacterized membrane protein YqaE (UPF0057 family)